EKEADFPAGGLLFFFFPGWGEGPGKEGAVILRSYCLSQAFFRGLRDNGTDGVRVAKGRVEDAPPVATFSRADGHAGGVVGSAGKYQVAVGFGGEIIPCKR